MIPLVTIFLSAFLLFQVQLIMGKMILPWFGGTPAVWTACMLFFQTMLLAGYAYSHWLSRRKSVAAQKYIHATLLILSLAFLGLFAVNWGSPLLPDANWKPTGDLAPQWNIILILSAAVGLPYFILSTSSPLIQHWQSSAQREEKVYRLYSISNAGSLLGLLSYPFVFEPLLALQAQAYLWTGGFLLFASGTLVLILRQSSQAMPVQESEVHHEKVNPTNVVIWLLLATCTSSLLLSVTNELCQEVASVPFLWMLPLSIYLITFIVSFDHPKWYNRRPILFFAAIFTFSALITSFLNIRLGIIYHIISLSGFLFFICLTCHGEIYRLKPPRSHLTLFYLTIAIGGAAGGFFVSVIAPLIFEGFWEFNISLTLAWVLLGVIYLRDKSSPLHQGDWLQAGLLLWMILFFLTRYLLSQYLPEIEMSWKNGQRVIAAAVPSGILSMTLVWLFRRTHLLNRVIWSRILIVAIIFFAESYMLLRIRQNQQLSIHRERNFFGTLAIEIEPPNEIKPLPSLRLIHGNINHGFQYLHPERSKDPVSYYGNGSGIFAAVNNHPRRLNDTNIRIGVLGLGVGTMAAFARPEDTVKFYEINPAVIDFSWRDQPYFSYIKDCKGSVELAVGDARLVMEQELNSSGSQQFDVLVVDAFSSDSVPVHLMTEEAFALYHHHLRDEHSIIAINISNRFLDFSDLVANQAKSINSTAYRFYIQTHSADTTPSMWMILIQNSAIHEFPALLKNQQPWQSEKNITWTDSFSNLWQIIK